MSLRIHVDPKTRPYLGPELRPHFILSQFGLRGSAMVAFQGPCKVETAEMVDWEDRLEKDRIESALMLHFMGEFFGMSLREGVFFQRLFIAKLYENLLVKTQVSKSDFRRSGDDLYFKERKLSVSIVTASPVSVVLHTGLNLDPRGAPVAAVGLGELGLTSDPLVWANEFLLSVQEEWESIEWACTKVRPVI